jgi:hypothetical protein
LKCHIDLDEKQWQTLRKLIPILKDVPMRVECYQIATEIDFSCYREIFHEIVNQCSKLPCLSLRNFYSHFSFRNYHSGQSAVINTSKKIPNEGSDDC